jgi:hypothetical protein
MIVYYENAMIIITFLFRKKKITFNARKLT